MAFEQWLLNEHLPLLTSDATYKAQVEAWFNNAYKEVVAHTHKNVAYYERKKQKVAPQDRLQCDLKIAEQWKVLEEFENDIKAKFLRDLAIVQEKAQLAQQQAQERLPDMAELMEEARVDEEAAAAFRSSARLGG